MKKINLSYIITTRNKLLYLQEAMKRLIANLQPDEEIIVIDGSSDDGSAEYLNGLYKKGYIHQFLSEPDICQAHGTNKGMLMARGELIKIITDDDVFFYPGIQKCKEFLLSHPQIDVLNGNIAVRYHNSPIQINSERQDEFLLWFQNNGQPFWFSDHGLFLRRDKLPIIGLWHTGVICIDVELTVRITALRQLNIAWYTGIIAVGMVSEDSNGARYPGTVSEDAERIYNFYIKGYSTKRYRMRFLKNIIHKIFAAMGYELKRLSTPLAQVSLDNIGNLIQAPEQRLKESNNPILANEIRYKLLARLSGFSIKKKEFLVKYDDIGKDNIVSEKFVECDAWLLANSKDNEQSYFYKDNAENKRLLKG
jgi:glycosyltransferase involved in cell wall biosynthesis